MAAVEIRMEQPWAEGVLAFVAAVGGEEGVVFIDEAQEPAPPASSLVGWPLALALGTAAAALWGFRAAARER